MKQGLAATPPRSRTQGSVPATAARLPDWEETKDVAARLRPVTTLALREPRAIAWLRGQLSVSDLIHAGDPAACSASQGRAHVEGRLQGSAGGDRDVGHPGGRP